MVDSGIGHRDRSDHEGVVADASTVIFSDGSAGMPKRRSRWVVWSAETAVHLVGHGIRLDRAWSVASAHRLIHGGWRVDPALSWAAAHDLDTASLPVDAIGSLFADSGESAVRSDGYLNPTWVAGGWRDTSNTRAEWAGLAEVVAANQRERIGSFGGPSLAVAHSESTTDLLCAEMEADGLPIDIDRARSILREIVGEEATSDGDAARLQRERDRLVLDLVPDGDQFDLRNPAQVKSLLRRVGIEVSDTRAWRLEALDPHPVVNALLAWRKAERFATTFGYGWLERFVGADGRLRGEWSSCDGAAGRMTATAGLHNMPAEMRPAVRAGDGWCFVRADLGQIEPRVLALVSGDEALTRATTNPDLYAPICRQLGIEREDAKRAMLGAMYGATTGHGGQALVGLKREFAVAMRYLDTADQQARHGQSLRTFGGRLVRMQAFDDPADGGSDWSRTSAQGRYGRNAMIQGAAAELFKMWAVIVRSRLADHDASIVLCLHDELVIHAPRSAGQAVADILPVALHEAAHRYSPGTAVNFTADVSIVNAWSDSKS
jgi:DNA polymerase I